MPDDRRPPPPVTIVDPGRPTAAPDLLVAGRERPPWRPSRLQVLLTALLLLVVTGTTGAVASTRHTADARHRDVAAVKALSLLVTDPASDVDAGPAQFAVAVRNEGPQPVQLLAVRVDYPGFRWQQVPARLASFETRNVVLNSTPLCTPSLSELGPQRLLARVITSRGTHHELSLGLLDGVVGAVVAGTAQRTCGMLPPGRAAEPSVTLRAGSGAREALLDLTMLNDSVLPLSIVAVAVTHPGFTLSLSRRLPLSIAPRPSPGVPGPAVVSLLRVHLADCALFRRDAGTDSDVGALSFTLARGSDRAFTDWSFGPEVSRAFATLARRC